MFAVNTPNVHLKLSNTRHLCGTCIKWSTFISTHPLGDHLIQVPLFVCLFLFTIDILMLITASTDCSKQHEYKLGFKFRIFVLLKDAYCSVIDLK